MKRKQIILYFLSLTFIIFQKIPISKVPALKFKKNCGNLYLKLKNRKMDLSKPQENDPQKHLLDLLKDKRVKFRSEIRNTRLSSELNEKRLKLLEFVPNSNHYLDITHRVINFDIFP